MNASTAGIQLRSVSSFAIAEAEEEVAADSDAGIAGLERGSIDAETQDIIVTTANPSRLPVARRQSLPGI